MGPLTPYSIDVLQKIPIKYYSAKKHEFTKYITRTLILIKNIKLKRKLGGNQRILKERVVHDSLDKPLVPSPHQSLVTEKVVDLAHFPSIESVTFE